jgi:hypothetical protein
MTMETRLPPNGVLRRGGPEPEMQPWRCIACGEAVDRRGHKSDCLCTRHFVQRRWPRIFAQLVRYTGNPIYAGRYLMKAARGEKMYQDIVKRAVSQRHKRSAAWLSPPPQ